MKRLAYFIINLFFFSFINVFILVFFLCQKKELEKQEAIEVVHSLTYRPFAPQGGTGGGSAVLSCQKILLGDNYKNYKLKYSFFENNIFSAHHVTELHDLWGGVLFAIKKTKKEKNTVYITHDYGTAFGLYLMGKKYVQISHLQGPRIEEKRNYGELFTYLGKWIIQYCEKKSFENAFYVCFPSKGAYEYFCNSKFKMVQKQNFRVGPVLYNTLYAFPEPEEVVGIRPEKDCMTFLSVGQFTYAKGIDRCPQFFSEMLKKSNRKIRWLVVGDGPLRDNILQKCQCLEKNNSNFSYKYIKNCSYSQMQYLQEICDIYLMLHRISIFDLTTLEVMNKSKVVILSNVGGNPEFNLQNNIILFNGNYTKTVATFLEVDIMKLSAQNKKVYDTWFSNDCFKKNYFAMIKDLTDS